MTRSYVIGPNSLRKVWPSLSAAEARTWARVLGQAMHEHGIVEPEDCANFVAQCGHESGEGRWLRELWGPSIAQRGYGQRRDLQGPGVMGPHIGYLYRGAGLIQTTGRVNFRAAAARLNVSVARLILVAGTKTYAARMAAVWWQHAFPHGTKGLSCEQVTRRVNGGTTGLAERQHYTARAMQARRYLVPRPA